MDFKKQLAEDLDKVFLNPREFGELHTLDGQELACVVDFGMSAVSTSSLGGLENASSLGLDQGGLTLYLADVIEPRPVPGQRILFDGDYWRVPDDPEAVSTRNGLLILELAQAFC